MTKDELFADILALREIVAMGQDKLNNDQYLDMEMIQVKVDEACQVVAEFSPEDAGEVREPLSLLLDELKSYFNIIGEHQKNLENATKDNDTKSTNKTPI
jgi:hypothetical protein